MKPSADFVAALNHDPDLEADSFESPFDHAPPDRTVRPAHDPTNPYQRPFAVLDYEFHHDVFVIFRPWENCGRCKKAVHDGALDLPETGDHVCPHTRKAEYLALNQKMLREGYRRVSHREETLKNGIIQVSLAWVVPTRRPKKDAPPGF